MSVTKERRAFLKVQCRLFAASVVEELEVIASGRFDQLNLNGEETIILENEKNAIADRIWRTAFSPSPMNREDNK